MAAAAEPDAHAATRDSELLVIDCGSGGTRVWARAAASGPDANAGSTAGAFARLPWPLPDRAPVLCKALRTEQGRAAFARAVQLLGRPCFIGATAGLRYALETGELDEKSLDAFRSLLPQASQFCVLSPIDEARYECLAMRQHAQPTDGMLSMGGKSMQIACGESVYSLPFALHAGLDIIRRGGTWPHRVDACSQEYRRRVLAEQVRQGFKMQGVFVCVTDIMILAGELGLCGRSTSTAEVVDILTKRMQEMPEAQSEKDLIHAARVCLMQALLSQVFPGCTFVFRDDFKVSWTAGLFAELDSGNSERSAVPAF